MEFSYQSKFIQALVVLTFFSTLPTLGLAVEPWAVKPSTLSAQETKSTDKKESPPIETTRPTAPKDQNLLDWSQDLLTDYLEGLNDGLDEFFVDAFFDEEITDDDYSGSRGKVFFQTRRELGETVAYQFGTNIKLVLPKTNKRFKLLIETEDDEENRDFNLTDPVDEVKYSTALRFIIFDTRKWKTTWDNGVRWSGGINPFSRLGARFVHKTENTRHRFSQQLFWTEIEGSGARSRFDVIHKFSHSMALRFDNSSTYWDVGNYYDMYSNISLLDQWGVNEAISYQLGVNGDTLEESKVSKYYFSVRYRKAIYKNWMFAEIEQEFGYPYVYDYKFTPAILFRLEMRFGQQYR